MFKTRKLIVFLLFFFVFYSKVNAEEAVTLNVNKEDKLKLESGVIQQATEAVEEKVNDSLILHGAIDLFSPKGISFDEGLVKSTKMGFVYDGPLVMQQVPGKDLASNYTVTGVELYNKTKFRDGKTELMTMFNFVRNLPNTQNGFTEKISEIAVTHHLNANQAILVGQGKRLPIGMEGQPLPQYQDTVARAQIARTFSNVRSIGVRNIGTYKYADYDIGVYDGTRYLQELFHGQEFVGWVNVKPLANLDEKKYGKLTLGSGCQVGHEQFNYNVIGAYVDYKYKKAEANFEYANANGYNALTPTNKKAGGFYTTLIYNVHPKVQLVARYDVFDPDKNVDKNTLSEYTAGVNYIVNPRLKFLLNYVRKDKQIGVDSNMLLFATRIML